MSNAFVPGSLLRPAKPDIVTVDLETSGLDVRFHEIIEIAAIRVDGTTFEERARFVALVRPIFPVDPEAAKVNGYTPDAWREEISLDAALRGLFPVIEGARWIGSKPSFDFDFVSMNARACGREMPALASRRLVDVSAMAEPLIDAGLIAGGGLEALRAYFAIDTGPAHRAENDALATLAVYRALLDLYRPAIELRRAT